MPSISRLTGRFFSVLILLILAMALPPAAVLGEAPPTLCQITEGLFGAKSGNDKKAAALSFVESALGADSKNVIDASGFRDGLGKIIDGVVACLNASVWAHK
jgi:hypothetical protein